MGDGWLTIHVWSADTLTPAREEEEEESRRTEVHRGVVHEQQPAVRETRHVEP